MAAKRIRPIRVEGNIAYVPLTQGYQAIIDAADVPLVEGFNWHVLVERRRDQSVKSIYAVRNFVPDEGKRRSAYMHRFLMPLPKGLQVDHIDGDGLNNRRANLRSATNSQNQHNQRLRYGNTSGIKGVSWMKRDRRWKAEIRVDGRRQYLGYFTDPNEAAAAYADASAKLHGQFGRTA